jgi:hypothetical protein
MDLRKDSLLTQQAPPIANRGSHLSFIVVMLAIRRQGEHPIIKRLAEGRLPMIGKVRSRTQRRKIEVFTAGCPAVSRL